MPPLGRLRRSDFGVVTGELVQWVQPGLADTPAWGSAALAALTYRRTRNRNGWLTLLDGAGVTPAQLEAVLRERPKTAELFCAAMRIAEETAQQERQRALAALVVTGVHSDSDQVDELLVLRRRWNGSTTPTSGCSFS